MKRFVFKIIWSFEKNNEKLVCKLFKNLHGLGRWLSRQNSTTRAQKAKPCWASLLLDAYIKTWKKQALALCLFALISSKFLPSLSQKLPLQHWDICWRPAEPPRLMDSATTGFLYLPFIGNHWWFSWSMAFK